MTSVVLLVWDHPTSVVQNFGTAMRHALASLGLDVTVLDVMDEGLVAREEELAEWSQDPAIRDCDLAIAISAAPLSARIGDQWVFEVIGKTFVYYILDTVIYDYAGVPGVSDFFAQARESPRLQMMAAESDGCTAINEAMGASVCFNLPFAGFFAPMPTDDIIRNGRIIVFGSAGPELVEVKAEESFADIVASAPESIAREALEGLAEEIERPDADYSIISTARRVLGLSAEEIFTSEIAAYLCRLDAYQKKRRRRMAVLALKDFPVDFYGFGWEELTEGFADCRHKGSVPHEELGKLCRKYNALLNFDPNWDSGLHDRAYTAIGSGCRVLNNRSKVIASLNLPWHDAMLTYDANNPDFTEIASYALSAPALDRDNMLEFRRRHSWLARMDDLMQEGDSGDEWEDEPPPAEEGDPEA